MSKNFNSLKELQDYLNKKLIIAMENVGKPH